MKSKFKFKNLVLVNLLCFMSVSTAFADRIQEGLRVSQCGDLKEVLGDDSALNLLKKDLQIAAIQLEDAKKKLDSCWLSSCKEEWSLRIDGHKSRLEFLTRQVAEEEERSALAQKAEDQCLTEWKNLAHSVKSGLLKEGGSINSKPETEKVDEASLSDEDLVSLLPEVTDEKYPIVASGARCGVNQEQSDCDYVVLELLSSSEKATPDDSRKESFSDDFLIEMAEEFNSKNKKTKSGKVIQIRVRKMASGTAYQYLSNGKYTGSANRSEGLAYSPSNSLWVKMLDARSGETSDYTVEPVAIRRKKIALKEFESDQAALDNVENNVDGVVGNVAGVFVRKDTFKEKFPNGKATDSCTIVNMAVNGELSIGYTNPYVSSTGLNFLWTALNCLSPGNPVEGDAVLAFRNFQKSVPALFETTLAMRESVRTGGSIEAGVVEYQSFVNTRLNEKGEPEVKMSDLFEFIPFGVRHDNPMVYVGQASLSQEENAHYAEGLKVFADFIASNRGAVRKAKEYGFFENASYLSQYELPEGDNLVTAQRVWKDNKSGGVPVVATFVADVSGSMEGGKISTLRKALEIASGFIRPDMNVGLIEYATQINELVPIQPFTTDVRRTFVQASRTLRADGGTPLYEALLVGMEKVLEKADQVQGDEDVKKMVFLLTDGEPSLLNIRDIEVDAILFYARRFGIQIHGIGFGSGAGEDVINELGILTEGAVLQIRSVEELNEKMAKLFNSQL